jgi:hypothetical protein
MILVRTDHPCLRVGRHMQYTISALKWKFTMNDLEPLHHFLGVSVQYQTDELFLTQHQFALNILECAGMVDCKLISTSVDTQTKFFTESKPPVADPTHFRTLVGALEYLTFISPDITYVIQ